MKPTSITASSSHQSDGLTAKRKDELYGRITAQQLAKFLAGKWSQKQFVARVKLENSARFEDVGSHFNYIDDGHVKKMNHHVRLNKRPLTGRPQERFGSFTQHMLRIDNTHEEEEQKEA